MSGLTAADTRMLVAATICRGTSSKILILDMQFFQ
jgi:hypothetical protein